jgi:hypothetical protein
MISTEDRTQKFRDDADRGYAAWLQRDQTQGLLALIPENTSRDVILRSAFDAGCGTGSVSVLLAMLDVQRDRLVSEGSKQFPPLDPLPSFRPMRDFDDQPFQPGFYGQGIK